MCLCALKKDNDNRGVPSTTGRGWLVGETALAVGTDSKRGSPIIGPKKKTLSHNCYRDKTDTDIVSYCI